MESTSLRNDFFVDALGGSDDNDGLSWDTAMKTSSAAMEASKVHEAEHQSLFPAAKIRNRIYFKPEEEAIEANG